MYETVTEMLKRELGQGIPAERIIVGGFSMGGALALHTAFHLHTNLAGVFACSSFLNHGSVVYESLAARKADKELPELLMFHGDR
jgi:phospholipase/carboxylesterase